MKIFYRNTTWEMFKHKPSILFFPVNGSGLGHLTRCLAYAKRLPSNYRISFFSLSPAVDAIERMGFYADYFVSPFLSDNTPEDWNAELALRLGLMLESFKPDVLLFDGTYPFKGLRIALKAYGKKIKLVWSKRGLLKAEAKRTPVKEEKFDLVICPGELGTKEVIREEMSKGHVKITVPPVALFDNEEFLNRENARFKLGLSDKGKTVLISLGAGNLKNVDQLSKNLIHSFSSFGFDTVLMQPPIALEQMVTPKNAIYLSIYPVAESLRAFDIIVSAAGYNSCCEIAQSGVPALLIPNELVADDQKKRAKVMSQITTVINWEDFSDADDALRTIVDTAQKASSLNGHNNNFINGAQYAATAIRDVVEN